MRSVCEAGLRALGLSVGREVGFGVMDMGIYVALGVDWHIVASSTELTLEHGGNGASSALCLHLPC